MATYDYGMSTVQQGAVETGSPMTATSRGFDTLCDGGDAPIRHYVLGGQMHSSTNPLVPSIIAAPTRYLGMMREREIVQVS